MKETIVSQHAQEYWYGKLKHFAPGTLPVAVPQGARTGAAGAGSYLDWSLSGQAASKFASVAGGHSPNEFMIGVTALAALLYKYQLDAFLVTTAGSIPAMTGNKALFFRFNPAGEASFKELVGQVKVQFWEGVHFQGYDYGKLQQALAANKAPVSGKLHEIGFGYDNGSDMRVETAEANQFRLFFLLRKQEKAFSLRLYFDPGVYDREVAGQLGAHFLAAAEQLLFRADSRIGDFSLLSEDEKHRQLVDFNQTCQEFPPAGCITRLFEEWATNTPNAPAVSAGNGFLSYHELNTRANRLAHHLMEGLGVKKGDLVAVMLDRSEHLVTALLATLKAGAAYVPIDPSYPAERINYILTDCGARVLLTESDAMWTVLNSYNGSIFAIDIQLGELSTPAGNPADAAGPGDLVYVIYTSGSTGNPKGVMVEHRSLANLCHWHVQAFGVRPSARATVFAGVGFDASAWEIWPYLLSGASLYLIKDQLRHGLGELADLLVARQITHCFLPTKLCEQLLALHPTPVKDDLWVLTGGDAFRGDAGTAWKVVNNYGPTESTVVATSGPVTAGRPGCPVSIGRPIANTRAYVLDQALSLLPLGVPGELYLSGAGTARGYLNQPGLTDQRFVANPFGEARLYRTGDVVRWLPDGTLEFLGRSDNQVKVRGYRIELGEIENTLLRHPQVKDAVVVARTGEGDTRLVAYACAGPHVREAALREHLETYLPAYMVPAHVVVLDAFPLNANGKVDRGQLPDSNQLVRQIQYRRPGTPMEEQLAALWEQVLGIAAPGADDNFFTVGGDSIKAIQVVSRLHSAGYKLEVKDLFRYPTIAALAPRITRAGAAADQAAVAGDVPLTPVQKEFFRATPADWHHYNQSVLLRSPVALEVPVLEDVFNAIVAHHDVLRSVYQEEAGTVQQTIPASGPRITCPVFDLREAAGAPAAMLAEADRLQGSFDPARGPLLRLGLFRLPDGDRLLIAVHHLVIDSVSWRILLEDITTLYRQRTNGEPLRLPAKTDSFKTWSEALARHADHKTFLREVPYWQGIEKATASPLPRDFAAGTNAVEDAETVSFGLSGALTGRLLTRANHAFNTTINDLLLTALGLAVHEVFGRQQLLVALEGHGREPLAEAVDVSRTVGWFTSIYPVLLNTAYAGDLGRQIKEVKEHLHRVPNNGVGYGILKHLTSRANKGDVDYCLQPEISFNYLGQFDTDLQASAFALAAESPGHMVSPRHTRWYSLDVSGSILDGELRLAIAYSRRQYRSETVEALASAYRNALERVIEYCAGRHKPEFTPSDFTARELTIEELEDLLNE